MSVAQLEDVQSSKAYIHKLCATRAIGNKAMFVIRKRITLGDMEKIMHLLQSTPKA